MRQQIAFGVALVSIAGLLILAGIVLTNPGANSHTPQAIISSIPSPVPPTTTSAVQPIVNTATLVPTPTPLPPSPTATAALTVMTPGVGVGTPPFQASRLVTKLYCAAPLDSQNCRPRLPKV